MQVFFYPCQLKALAWRASGDGYQRFSHNSLYAEAVENGQPPRLAAHVLFLKENT
jgi:hypothetical protein